MHLQHPGNQRNASNHIALGRNTALMPAESAFRVLYYCYLSLFLASLVFLYLSSVSLKIYEWETGRKFTAFEQIMRFYLIRRQS